MNQGQKKEANAKFLEILQTIKDSVVQDINISHLKS